MRTDLAIIELPADVSRAGEARRLVRRASTEADADPAVVDDLQLIASELFTNAVEHGDGTVVTVRVVARDATIGVSVENVGRRAVAPSEHWTVSAPDARSGRGLGIVRRLADAVDVVVDDTSLRITAWVDARTARLDVPTP